MLNFNLKKFLSLPLNDGTTYESYGGCGCIKGNFTRSTVFNSSFFAYSLCGAPAFPQVSTLSNLSRDLISQAKAFGYQPKTQRTLGTLHDTDDRLSKTLDIGEYILLRGYPQKAKLYVAHMIEKYNLCNIVAAPEGSKTAGAVDTPDRPPAPVPQPEPELEPA
jgi:hypothetical protein